MTSTNLVTNETAHQMRRADWWRYQFPLHIAGFLLWIGIIAALLLGIRVLLGSEVALIFGNILLAGALFCLCTPLFINMLVDDPQKKHVPYLFTFVRPGEIKCVIRGGVVIRYLANLSGNRFKRQDANVDRHRDPYWDIVEGDDPAPLLISKWYNPFLWWVAYVYYFTGALFVGIWPWQKLYIYPLQRLVRVGQYPDMEAKEAEANRTKMEFAWRTNRSDHVRGREFPWYVVIESVEVRERVSLKISLALRVKIVNPQKALFNTERWDQTLTNAIVERTISIVRTMPLDNVLVATDKTRRELAEKVVQVSTAMEGSKGEGQEGLEGRFGIMVLQVQVLDYQVDGPPEVLESLTAPWRGEQTRKATVTIAKGDAERVKRLVEEPAKVMREYGQDARIAQLARQQVDTAAASDTTFLAGNVGSEQALLAELHRQQGENTPRRRPNQSSSKRKR